MKDIEVVIKNKIHNIRGKQVMLDSDLAMLYGVEVKRLNEQVKRNIDRFPEDFMFRISKIDKEEVVANCDHLSNLKFSYQLPYVFTEQGVAMLSSILRSKKAVEVNIQIMRAFVEMRRFLSQNSEVFEKFQRIDKKLLVHDDNFNKIFEAMQKKQLMPSQGIFFEGQVFDAFLFASDLVRKAKKRLVLFDNYVGESTLKLFSDKAEGVSVKIYTKNVSEKLLLAVKKFNEQHSGLEIFVFDKSHDRFLIIDDEVYHFGASLKDLGKKWFAFSKLELDTKLILDRIPQ